MANRPDLLTFLIHQLGYHPGDEKESLGFPLFKVDMSSLKLRLGNETPVIWIKASDLDKIGPRELIQSLEDIVRECDLGYQTILVILDGDGGALLNVAHNPLYSFVFIDGNAQRRIMELRRPTGELCDVIASQISISHLAPYEIAAPVTGSRFFGRDAQLKWILSNSDTNFLVLGIRRIGKTSLLRELERIFLTGSTCHPVYFDCSDLKSTDLFMQEVVRKLNVQELPRLALQNYSFFFPDFLDRMRRKYHKKIVFLLDEIDTLLKLSDAMDLFSMLRTSSNKGSCQYIMAGFWEAWNAQYRLDHPFFNFAQQVRLPEFSRQTASEMIVLPMENLRVQLKNRDEIVTRIYRETAGHPNLIQYYCTILLKGLDQRNERIITPEQLLDVYNDDEFQDHLLVSFMHNTGNREKAIVYSTLLNQTVQDQVPAITQPIIYSSMRKQGIVMSQKEIDDACNYLVLAGTFHRKGQDFSFNSPVFVHVLRHRHNLIYLLGRLKKEGL